GGGGGAEGGGRGDWREGGGVGGGTCGRGTSGMAASRVDGPLVCPFDAANDVQDYGQAPRGHLVNIVPPEEAKKQVSSWLPKGAVPPPAK
ncbi:hypothetical protein THAOC_22361, partial [Thalassiosira oceanica]